jgi:high frequency lysogenization protein
MTSPHYHPLRNRVLALAAMVQTAHLVQGIARKGIADSGELECAINSVLVKSESGNNQTEDIYQGPQKLRTGLILLQRLLSGGELGTDIKQVKEVMAYCAAMMSVERKLSRNREMLGKLGEGLERVQKQRDYFGSVMHDNVIAAVAGLYGETISQITPRIIVHGKPVYLGQSSNTNKVRALLLSGIRGAHQWRIHGGSHFQLLLRRRALAREAQQLLQHNGYA